MGDALIDVWFSLLGLCYSLAHMYKVLKKLFFSCIVDFKVHMLNNIEGKKRHCCTSCENHLAICPY